MLLFSSVTGRKGSHFSGTARGKRTTIKPTREKRLFAREEVVANSHSNSVGAEGFPALVFLAKPVGLCGSCTALPWRCDVAAGSCLWRAGKRHRKMAS